LNPVQPKSRPSAAAAPPTVFEMLRIWGGYPPYLVVNIGRTYNAETIGRARDFDSL
jgi:hypothetical protein